MVTRECSRPSWPALIPPKDFNAHKTPSPDQSLSKYSEHINKSMGGSAEAALILPQSRAEEIISRRSRLASAAKSKVLSYLILNQGPMGSSSVHSLAGGKGSYQFHAIYYSCIDYIKSPSRG